MVSGNGPRHGPLSQGLQQTRQRRSVGTESHGRSLRLFGMSATCGGRLGENDGALGAERHGPGVKQLSFRGASIELGLRWEMLFGSRKAITTG